MSRLIYSNVNLQPGVGLAQQPVQYVQTTAPIQQTVVEQVQQPVQYITSQAPIQQTVVEQVPVATTIAPVQQSAIVSQPVEVVQAPVAVQQQAVVEGPPPSQGPVQTTVQQGQTQMGESRFEYIPKEKVWVEYEAVQSTEYVPKEVKLTDHYAVEHITEYHPKVFQDTYVDYHPIERNVERVEYQQQVKKLQHPIVQSEITETILASIPGPQTLIESKSQIVETGRTENISSVQTVQQPVVQQVQTVQQPVAQQVQQVPVVGSRIVQQPVSYVQQPQIIQQSRVVQPIQEVQQFVQPTQTQIVQGLTAPQLNYAPIQTRIQTTPIVNSSRVVLK